MSLRETIARWLLRPRIAPGIEELRRKHTGAGSRLSDSVQVYGWKGVRIGRNSAICEDTLLNALNCPGEQPAIVIGDHCFIGRRNFLNAGATLVFGDYCLTGTDSTSSVPITSTSGLTRHTPRRGIRQAATSCSAQTSGSARG